MLCVKNIANYDNMMKNKQKALQSLKKSVDLRFLMPITEHIVC